MAGFLSIYTNFAFVQVWNEHPVALCLVQVLRLPFDLICNTPPLL